MMLIMALPRLGFVHWISETPSGGNTYDGEVLRGLRTTGADVAAVTLSGPINPGAAQRISEALSADRIWLVDGIVAVEMPDVIAAAVAAGRSVTVLVHHFGTDAPELTPTARQYLATREATALRAASGVLCTSRWAAAELARRYGILDAGVAVPGAPQARLAPWSWAASGPRIVSVGALTPTKDPHTLVTALSRLTTRRWTACLVGAETGTEYAAKLRAFIEDVGLSSRIRLAGVLTGARLEEQWMAADVLVHLSRSETYGLVVAEALAHGVPAIVALGSGAVEALGAGRLPGAPTAGATLAPGDSAALGDILGRWLDDGDLRRRWRSAAVDQRGRLPTWPQTVTAVLDYLVAAGRA